MPLMPFAHKALHKARKALALPPTRRRLLLEATACLALAQGALRILPFRLLRPMLGRPAAPDTTPPPVSDLHTPQEIAWAIQVAASQMPHTPACLARAIAAKHMLRLRNLPSLLYLGVQSPQETAFAAHAWLRCHDLTITGHEEEHLYLPITAFL